MISPASPSAVPQVADEAPPSDRVDLRREFNEVGIGEVLDQLDRELIGLKPVKTRIREIASLLLSRMTVPVLFYTFTRKKRTVA